MIDEVARWHGLAALLPPAQAQEFRDCWEIGEQEAGLDLLVAGLLEHRVPISDTTRAEIAVTAEDWGVWATLAPGLGRCLGGGPGDGPVTLIEHAGTVPLPGSSVGADTAWEALLVVPWLACTRCDRMLARAHHREGWGDLSFDARRYVLFAPDRSEPVRLFAPESVWEAFTALRESCGPW
ncbi:hypothetical protein ACWGQ4_24670 [Streptomyces sp. NPDC055721]|uniref:hypothetical protein n=1 Tax=Streptomyces sp. NPDC127132 TaxID=3345374 RepID=UPI003635A4CC